MSNRPRNATRKTKVKVIMSKAKRESKTKMAANRTIEGGAGFYVVLPVSLKVST